MNPDYLERVYAGVLGKIIGVYLGRPFEGWERERIERELGEIWYYVHERVGVPLIVTDDDISGTFAFLRALEDTGYPKTIRAEQVGESWLNYLIEGRTVLWWGGMGNSTEHTAYLRLKAGVSAPRSGSAELNGRVVAEQIGAQIFIDGWGMVAPGDPDLAARLAGAAASVSHDGEAIYGAQVIAVMEALAFVEPDRDKLLDEALRRISADSVIARMIRELRELHVRERDWRAALRWLDKNYGYAIWGGNCHIIPNHGLIILALLWGDDDFQRSLMIVNTGGWDTDCNSGNLGCLLGIKNGLAGLEAGPDWRGPVADRLFLPTADGGRAITDAATEALHIANAARRMRALDPIRPKDGARFHFHLPGSVQGFQAEPGVTAEVSNPDGRLCIRYHHVAPGTPVRVATPTFIPAEYAKAGGGYDLLASPTLYPGQSVRCVLFVDRDARGPARCSLYARYYGEADRLEIVRSEPLPLEAGARRVLEWTVPDLGGYPTAAVGLEIASEARADGTIHVDALDWSGCPRVTLGRPAVGGAPVKGWMWGRAWVNGVDVFNATHEPYRLMQNTGRGLVMQGTREWRDYRVEAVVTPHIAEAAGIAVRVQGMRRYYALLVGSDGQLRLVKVVGRETVLARSPGAPPAGTPARLELEVSGDRIRGRLDGGKYLEARDRDLEGGGVGLVCEVGRVAVGPVSVGPAAP